MKPIDQLHEAGISALMNQMLHNIWLHEAGYSNKTKQNWWTGFKEMKMDQLIWSTGFMTPDAILPMTGMQSGWHHLSGDEWQATCHYVQCQAACHCLSGVTHFLFPMLATPPKMPRPLGATPPMPHPLRIEKSNICSHVKSQVPSIKNDWVMAFLVIYSKATPTKMPHPLGATPPTCHTPCA